MDLFVAAAPILLAVAMAVVVIVMFMGLYTMGRGGSRGSRLSNKMMRLRVIIQGLALAILGVVILFTQR